MKQLLVNILQDESDDLRRRSTTREYLQARVLLALQDHGAFTNWAFVGGTALRFLFGLPRYSEDLDFSLANPNTDARFERLMRAVRSDLTAEAYDVTMRIRTDSPVASAFIKFRGLLHELGLSPHADEVFTVKVEIDTNPPAGAGVETRIIRRFAMLNLLHHDRASLIAGKLHAVLTRKYTKGRDLYDLVWYLSDRSWPAPNLVLLNNALRQTGWQEQDITSENWRQFIADGLARVDWNQALRDVSPFLERKQDAALVSSEILISLLQDR